MLRQRKCFKMFARKTCAVGQQWTPRCQDAHGHKTPYQGVFSCSVDLHLVSRGPKAVSMEEKQEMHKLFASRNKVNFKWKCRLVNSKWVEFKCFLALCYSEGVKHSSTVSLHRCQQLQTPLMGAKNNNSPLKEL